MADPINHDGVSTVATVGSSAAKWGLIGAIASFAIPALVIGAPLLLIGASLGGVIGSILGVVGIVGGLAAGIGGAAVGGGYAAGGGALLGVFKGGQQVSDENRSHSAHVQQKVNNGRNKSAKMYNDGEVKGLQEGYAIAVNDMESMAQQREQVAYQKGQESVVRKIQEQMAAQQKQGLAQQAAPAEKSHTAGLSASCKCESMVAMVDQKRAEEAAAAKHKTQ